MSQVSIGEAIKEFLSKSKLKDGVRAAQIADVWEEVMGKTIAKYTDKIYMVQNTLFITTSVGPLKQELIYQKLQIIKRLNEALQDNVIQEVVIQ